jgi:Tfp pilus assembly protein PilF
MKWCPRRSRPRSTPCGSIPGLAETPAVLAHIKFFYDWDFPAAEAEYRRALELNSGSADAHHFYGVMLMWTGRLRRSG